ncbi:MAG: hydrogenase maturation protein [Alphaproteobacteria bacterium]
MRILFLTHAFNGLTQRLYVELARRGHALSVEFDINDAVTAEAVALFRPDVVLAPFLRRAIPMEVWRRCPCLVVHPGPEGDRGPSALDWAIMEGAATWGVTVLQAEAAFDAGPVWASVPFPMRPAAKSSLYRNEVTEAAVVAVLEALARLERGDHHPRRPAASHWRPLMTQADRRIDWETDGTASIVRKIHAGDGSPGVLDVVDDGRPCHLFGAHAEEGLRGPPGRIVAQREGAICRATVDGAVWITHLRRQASPGEPSAKLPAALVLGGALREVPEVPAVANGTTTFRDLWYERRGAVGYLHFPLHNGAMSAGQCRRLTAACQEARRDDARVLVLMGGDDFWSNGIHLHVIEAADSPADESWRTINAMDDLCHALLTTTDRLVVAALHGNAAAGGVFLALAADRVVAREGIVLNPHYRNMGNLHGSEYWTYLLPKRLARAGIGPEGIDAVMARRLPMGAPEARALGLVDECLPGSVAEFRRAVAKLAEDLAALPDLDDILRRKSAERETDERVRPLAAYRDDELRRMRLNFYGFDPSYHVARYNFVFRVPHSRTPLHLARHRGPRGVMASCRAIGRTDQKPSPPPSGGRGLGEGGAEALDMVPVAPPPHPDPLPLEGERE